MTATVKRVAFILLAYFSTMPLIFGWVAGLICHRMHDGWVLSRRMLNQLDDAVVDAIRAELAKPSAPAWHDAPTEPGIWLCDEGGPDCYTYTAHNIVLLNDPALKDDECRWYGPIPQDGAKAQGGAA